MKATNRFRKWLSCLVIFLVPSMVFAEWDVKKIDGSHYVSLREVKDFYRLDTLERAEKDIVVRNKNIVLKFDVGSKKCQLNGTNLVLRDEVKEENGEWFLSASDLNQFLDPLLRPAFIEDAGNFNTVILDPGYGGKNQGAKSEWGTAAEHALAIANLAKQQLEKRYFRVVMTRQEDQDLSMQERVKIANEVKESAIFINITFDSGPSDRRGISTFALAAPDGKLAEEGGGMSNASVALGMAVHGSVIGRIGMNTEDRGLERVRFSALTEVKHPRISVNAGYLTHQFDARQAHNGKYRDAVANGVADGVLKYRTAVTRKAVGKD